VASLWKHPNSPFWAACFTVYTPTEQLRWKRSVKTRELKLARKIADVLEEAGRGAVPEREIRAFCEKISDARVRRATTKIFGDVFRTVHGREIGGASLRAFADSWLKRIQGELAPQSYDKYKQVADSFIAFIGPAAARDVTSFGAHDDVLVVQFRDELAARVAPSTVNTTLKIVRQMFKVAAQRFKIESPSQHVGGIKLQSADGSRRRAFTLPEIGRIFRTATGGEWEGMCLGGLYTAQRLSDIATWRWENLDLVRRELAFTSRKTGRRMIIPIAEPLADYLLALPATDEPTAFVFPIAAGFVARSKSEQSATLSNQFHDLLARAGLVRRRSHAKAKDGKGRTARRRASEISFHSFRHTATSLLKNAGIPESTVMDIVGHESKAVSQVYTHVGEAEKRAAVAALPSLRAVMRAAAASPKADALARAKTTRKQN
jgi:integrase